MEIIQQRLFHTIEETLSVYYLEGVIAGFILEDQPQTKKIFGETRIPAGTYELELRTEGTTHEKYLRRFPEFHKGMIHLLNVPNFKYILYHIGNKDDDTAGCMLAGSYPFPNGNGGSRSPSVTSRTTHNYKQNYKRIVNVMATRKVYWTVKDETDLSLMTPS